MKPAWMYAGIVPVCALLFLLRSCAWPGDGLPEAARLAHSQFSDCHEFDYNYLRMVDTNLLAAGCLIMASDRYGPTVAWPVPEQGHLAVLDEEPNRHDPHKRLRRIVAFISRDRDEFQFVTRTNGLAESISIQMADGTLRTNFSWTVF